MPWINTLKDKKKKTLDRRETDMRKLRKTAYNTTKWRKIRAAYIHEHPICERCLMHGEVRAAEDIHHIDSPFRGGQINWEKLFDSDNLMAVCKECHAAIHNEQQGHVSAEDVLKQLDDLLNDNIKDEDL